MAVTLQQLICALEIIPEDFYHATVYLQHDDKCLQMHELLVMSPDPDDDKHPWVMLAAKPTDRAVSSKAVLIVVPGLIQHG